MRERIKRSLPVPSEGLYTTWAQSSQKVQAWMTVEVRVNECGLLYFFGLAPSADYSGYSLRLCNYLCKTIKRGKHVEEPGPFIIHPGLAP